VEGMGNWPPNQSLHGVLKSTLFGDSRAYNSSCDVF
jgi:hypothetical protein